MLQIIKFVKNVIKLNKMNIEKIEIQPRKFVWVDKGIRGKSGLNYNFGLKKVDSLGKDYTEHSTEWNYCFKIIAASSELNLEGVPTYVKWLAEQEYSDEEIVMDVDISESLKLAFIKGYKTTEQEMFTEDDLKKAFACGKAYQSMYGDTALEQIIEQIKSEKK